MQQVLELEKAEWSPDPAWLERMLQQVQKKMGRPGTADEFNVALLEELIFTESMKDANGQLKVIANVAFSYSIIKLAAEKLHAQMRPVRTPPEAGPSGRAPEGGRRRASMQHMLVVVSTCHTQPSEGSVTRTERRRGRRRSSQGASAGGMGRHIPVDIRSRRP